jgi:hypothetical protein
MQNSASRSLWPPLDHYRCRSFAPSEGLASATVLDTEAQGPLLPGRGLALPHAVRFALPLREEK